MRTPTTFLQLCTNILAVIAMFWCIPAHPTDLLQAWQAASQNDADLAAARLEHQAGSEHTNQAKGLWRPNVTIHGAVGAGAQNSKTRNAQFSAPGMGTSQGVNFDTSINHGNYSSYGIVIKQPLIDFKRKAQSKQLKHSGEQADIAWLIARQNAILKTSEKYFNTVLAHEQLNVVRQQKEAVSALLKQAQARFNSGDASILETHEAKARLGQINAESELAKTRYEMAKLEFEQSTGLAASGIKPLKDKPAILLQRPAESLAIWLEKAQHTAPELQYSMLGTAMAQDLADSLKPTAQANLNLLGLAGHNHISGHGNFGHAANNSNQWAVGLELQIPLYTGGIRSSEYREALARRDSMAMQNNSTLQRVQLLTQELWLSLDTGPARIQDLDLSYQASLARQQAIKLGVDIGDRTFVDQIDAQRDVAHSKLALSQAWVQLALDQMRLQAVAGNLDENILQLINQAISD